MAMFGLFKKKEKPEEKKPAGVEAEELRAFAADFLPEEMTILAVTGAGQAIRAQNEGDCLYTVAAGLTAWMEEDSPDIHRGLFRLTTKADDTLSGYLIRRMPRDFILKCKVRPHADGKSFLLLNLPESAFDPDLKAILEQQKMPVTEMVEGLGEFTFNRSMGAFQMEAPWGEGSVLLSFDRETDRGVIAATGKALLADAAVWAEKARALAADTLLEQANEICEANEAEPMERDELMDCMEMENIDLAADGTFQLWFNDGGMLFGKFFRVSGSVSGGLTEAALEG